MIRPILPWGMQFLPFILVIGVAVVVVVGGGWWLVVVNGFNHFLKKWIQHYAEKNVTARKR